MTSTKEIEEGNVLMPQFDDKGLIPCITTSAKDGAVLMFAWMNEEALNKTIETREMYYYSRSRAELWHKGATSGFIQKLVELRIDCDQDCLWATVEVDAPSETACHTGRRGCFYREVVVDDGGKIKLS